MRAKSDLNGSTGNAYLVVPGAQVARLGRQTACPALNIHQQVDQVLVHKQARDLGEDWRAVRECGCRQCRQAYRMTRAFYDTLGLKPPARECISTPHLILMPPA